MLPLVLIAWAVAGCGSKDPPPVSEVPKPEPKGDPAPPPKPREPGGRPQEPTPAPIPPEQLARLTELETRGASISGPLPTGGYVVGLGRDLDAAALLPLFDGLTCVVELRIESDALTDDRLKYLAELARLEDLALLRCEKLTGVGFASFGGLARLKKFSATECPLADEACKHLAKCLALEEVSLSRTKVTDAGLRELAALPALAALSLYETPITGTGFAAPGWGKLKLLDAPGAP
ncbi:MAG: hypothetical protein K2V38_16985, partial [Gemmataceae bacterium]|nr:hypothetical protein [Gemmataceae bacterium]